MLVINDGHRAEELARTLDRCAKRGIKVFLSPHGRFVTYASVRKGLVHMHKDGQQRWKILETQIVGHEAQILGFYVDRLK